MYPTTPNPAPQPDVYSSGRPPQQALHAAEIQGTAAQLTAYHDQFQDLFARREQRHWSLLYLRGQLSDLERKTVEPMVQALRGVDPAAVRAMQTFLGEGAWDDAALRRRHQQLVAQTLASPDGVLIVDGSGFPKQGHFSVGVARQYCGHLGKIANCQQGVFAAYSSAKGCTFADCRLYMPQRWFDETHDALRTRCAVPESLRFHTEPQLALQMVKTLAQRGELPFTFVLGDETYGVDPKFLDGVEAAGRCYFVEVPATTQVYLGQVQILPPSAGAVGRPRKYPRVAPGTAAPVEVRNVAAGLPQEAWLVQTLKEGTKGPIRAQIACVPVTRCRRKARQQPGARAWLILRRGLAAGSEVKMFLSNAPPDCSAEQLGRLSAMRWPIETLFQEAKGELGMDHYEVRSFRCWHHQMTMTFLAHHFLVRLRQGQEKKAQR